jgi:NOL1/NOP2/fmu family ribosome biogenesis protein
MLYLRREFIPLKTNELGAVLLTWKGFNMGTANAVKNGLNNLLPMEWRVRSQFSASSIFVL